MTDVCQSTVCQFKVRGFGSVGTWEVLLVLFCFL